jgi:hypothetical protein
MRSVLGIVLPLVLAACRGAPLPPPAADAGGPPEDAGGAVRPPGGPTADVRIVYDDGHVRHLGSEQQCWSEWHERVGTALFYCTSDGGTVFWQVALSAGTRTVEVTLSDTAPELPARLRGAYGATAGEVNFSRAELARGGGWAGTLAGIVLVGGAGSASARIDGVFAGEFAP